MVTSRETAAGRLAGATAGRSGIQAGVAIEALVIAVLPVALYFLLRLQLMPVPDLDDPAMHIRFSKQAPLRPSPLSSPA